MTAEPPPSAKPRLPEGERERTFVEEATRYFAEVGFRGTTRELARRLGVAQPLLYRYFPTKQRLIDRIYDGFAAQWRPEWSALLVDPGLSLDQRLKRFYGAYTATYSKYTTVRLFMFANLEHLRFADRYTSALDERILKPILAGLRAEAGLPGLADQPMADIERELVMTLHGGIVFLGIRKHIYGTPLPDDLSPLIALHVDAFLDRAGAVLRRLAGAPTP